MQTAHTDVLLDDLFCEILSGCAFFFLAISFIPFLSFLLLYHTFPNTQKVCKLFFNLHTFFTSSVKLKFAAINLKKYAIHKDYDRKRREYYDNFSFALLCFAILFACILKPEI